MSEAKNILIDRKIKIELSDNVLELESLKAEAMGWKAANEACAIIGDSPKYIETDFFDLAEAIRSLPRGEQ